MDHKVTINSTDLSLFLGFFAIFHHHVFTRSTHERGEIRLTSPPLKIRKECHGVCGEFSAPKVLCARRSLEQPPAAALWRSGWLIGASTLGLRSSRCASASAGQPGECRATPNGSELALKPQRTDCAQTPPPCLSVAAGGGAGATLVALQPRSATRRSADGAALQIGFRRRSCPD